MSRYLRPGSEERSLEDLHLELRAFRDAVDQVNQIVADRLGINRTDLRCLSIIQSRGPLTAGQLAEAAGLTSGAVTTVVDRLERAGYARRLPDPADRRRVLVDVTSKAGRDVGSIYKPLVEETNRRLARYSPEELALIRDFIRQGREITEEHARRLAGREPAGAE